MNTDRIYPSPVCHTPPVFSPEPDADAQDILSRARSVNATDTSTNADDLDLSKPSIGIYGKVGVLKGSLDLVAALSNLRTQGLDFNFLAMTQGEQLNAFEEEVRRAGLGDCTWMIPFVPNWRVPRFIRTCTAVCFLERDFPIKHHGPRIPREIFACGTCLILSGEIANKQANRASLSDGENLLVVDDPRDIDDLAAVLESVIQDPERAQRIGGDRGFALSQEFDRHESLGEDMEDVLLRAIGKPSSARSFNELAEESDEPRQTADDPAPFLSFLSPTIPWADLFESDQFDEAARAFRSRKNQDSGADPASTLRFLRYLDDERRAHRLDARSPIADDIIRFEKARLQVNWGLEMDEPGALPCLKIRQYTNGTAGPRKPQLEHGTLVESFRHPIASLFRESDMPTHGDIASHFHERVEHLTEGDQGVIFQRLPNGNFRVFTAGAIMRDILARCDGSREIMEIIDETSSAYGLQGDGGTTGATDMQNRMLSFFEALQKQDVIVMEA